MEFIKVGKCFKTKSGKATILILSTEDLKTINANAVVHEKYGKQTSLLITGTSDGQYGHGISIIKPEEKKEVKAEPQNDSIDPNDLPF
jgi:hypothetical protein